MPQETLNQIKAIKQGLLNKAFKSLLSHPHIKEMYREFGEGSFDSFTLQFHMLYDDNEEIREKVITQPIDKEKYSPEMYLQIIEKRERIARSMIGVNYKSPSFNDEDSLIMHLHLMWHLYETGISWPPSIESLCLDLSFAKLLSAAHRQIVSKMTKAEMGEPRTRKSTEKKREKAEDWKSFVRAIYEHGKSIAPKTRLSEAIKMVQKQFGESKDDEEKKREVEPKWGFIH